MASAACSNSSSQSLTAPPACNLSSPCLLIINISTLYPHSKLLFVGFRFFRREMEVDVTCGASQVYRPLFIAFLSPLTSHHIHAYLVFSPISPSLHLSSIRGGVGCGRRCLAKGALDRFIACLYLRRCPSKRVDPRCSAEVRATFTEP